MKLKVSVTISDSVIVIAGAFDVVIHGSHTPAANKNSGTRIEARGKKEEEKGETRRIRVADIFFSSSEEFDNLPPVRLKSVGRVVKGVQRWKPAAEKNGRVYAAPGETRDTRDIFAGEKPARRRGE